MWQTLYASLALLVLLISSQPAVAVSANTSPAEVPGNEITTAYKLYTGLEGDHKPAFTAFSLALKGYQQLKASGKVDQSVLSVIDFSLPSSQKRMWIIDVEAQKILHHTYVAHGKNTGLLMAEHFSNRPNSLQSSLGFYLTDNVYYGKHGRSLRLNGMEPGINDKARQRAVVLHGADYATEAFVKNQGRLGRSFGCPAVPRQETDQIIDWVKEGTVLFIYHSNPTYLEQSPLLADL